MKYCVVLVIFFISLLYPKVVLGQDDKPSPVQFHGSNTLTGQYSDRQGVNQEIPPSLFRNDLQITLTVYEIPVSSSFFITSEDRDYRQSINNFKIFFDYKQLKEKKGFNIDNLTENIENLEKALDELEKYTNLLNEDYLDKLKSVDDLQSTYDKAKEELNRAGATDDQNAIKDAETKLAETKDKLKEEEAKYKEAKAKFEKAEAALEKMKAKLEQAKKLAESPELMAGKAEEFARSQITSKFGRFLSVFSKQNSAQIPELLKGWLMPEGQLQKQNDKWPPYLASGYHAENSRLILSPQSTIH
jgi:tetratricopeptide (TPR) repeat protein